MSIYCMEKGAIPNEKFFFWKWIYWGARGMEEREDPSMIMYVYSLCTMLEKRKVWDKELKPKGIEEQWGISGK